MKKAAALILTMVMLLSLVGCGTSKQADDAVSDATVYSFSGENEVCSIINGVAVIGSEYQTLYGGDLNVKSDSFKDMTSYAMTFYISSNEGKQVLLSNAVHDSSGSFGLTHQKIGQITGQVFDNTDALKETLYFELEATNDKGETQKYTIPMEVTEITKTAED